MSIRDTTQIKKADVAHFLHQKSGLEMVLRPPVEDPRAMCWIPNRAVLLVATQSGELVEVDPVMGTRHRSRFSAAPSALCVDPHGKRYALTTEAGEWLVGEIDGEVLFRAHHGLDGPLELFLLKRNLVLLGQHKGKRTVHIWVDGDQKFSRALPDRTCVFPGAGGKLRCAHSTARGLRVAGLSRSNVFSNAPSTQHKLYGSSAGVLGITEYGVVVWKEQGGQAESIGFLDACVGALSADGAWVGLGTVGGLVAIVSMASHQSRSEPNVIKSGALPFRDLAFSERDRWMATISDSIQLWTWEAGD